MKAKGQKWDYGTTDYGTMGPVSRWDGTTVDGTTVGSRGGAGSRGWGGVRCGGDFGVHGCRSFSWYSRTFWGGIPDRPCPGGVFWQRFQGGFNH